MIRLSEQEMKELTSRFFNGVQINEHRSSEQIIHTLQTGRVVKGIVENGALIVTEVTDFLCG